MTAYARLNDDGTITDAPDTYRVNNEVIFNFTLSPQMMAEHGYYELTYPDGEQDGTPTYTLREPAETEVTVEGEDGEPYTTTEYDIPYPVIEVRY